MSRSTLASSATRTAPSRSYAARSVSPITPGGIFKYDRIVEGLRNSALGGMWDPAYFNYGIAIHGAINVPETPASHGCIRVPQTIGKMFHEFIAKGDSVFVWDGIEEPEVYASNASAAYPRGQVPPSTASIRHSRRQRFRRPRRRRPLLRPSGPPTRRSFRRRRRLRHPRRPSQRRSQRRRPRRLPPSPRPRPRRPHRSPAETGGAKSAGDDVDLATEDSPE